MHSSGTCERGGLEKQKRPTLRPGAKFVCLWLFISWERADASLALLCLREALQCPALGSGKTLQPSETRGCCNHLNGDSGTWP